MTQERRKHERYPFNAIALVREKTGGSDEAIPTLTENISLNGIEFHSHINIEEGTRVEVELKFTNRDGIPTSDIIEGTIVWHSYRGNYSAMGLSFNKALSSEDNPALYDYFRYVSKT